MILSGFEPECRRRFDASTISAPGKLPASSPCFGGGRIERQKQGKFELIAAVVRSWLFVDERLVEAIGDNLELMAVD